MAEGVRIRKKVYANKIGAKLQHLQQSIDGGKRGRKTLSAELPRVEVIHDLPLDQRHCPEGHVLKVIGEAVSEQLDIIATKMQVLGSVPNQSLRCYGANKFGPTVFWLYFIKNSGIRCSSQYCGLKGIDPEMKPT